MGPIPRASREIWGERTIRSTISPPPDIVRGRETRVARIGQHVLDPQHLLEPPFPRVNHAECPADLRDFTTPTGGQDDPKQAVLTRSPFKPHAAFIA